MTPGVDGARAQEARRSSRTEYAIDTICFVSLSSSRHFMPDTWYFASFGLRTVGLVARGGVMQVAGDGGSSSSSSRRRGGDGSGGSGSSAAPSAAAARKNARTACHVAAERLDDIKVLRGRHCGRCAHRLRRRRLHSG